MVRFEGVAGEFTQHDFGQVWVPFVDGCRTKAQFFASRSKYSRMVRETVTPNQNAESLCRAFAEHLDDFGGVPLLAVFDRPKTVAIKWRGDGTVTHSTRATTTRMCSLITRSPAA